MSKDYKGVASMSKSVFSVKEPRNTKFIFEVLVNYILDELQRNLDTVSFIQVGANDGVRGDFLSMKVKAYMWTGLLIEPVAEARVRLGETYKKAKNLTIVPCAIWEEEGCLPFYKVYPEDVISSFSLETIMLHGGKYDDLEGMITVIEVPTRRLDTLAREYGFNDANLLAVDAEGCDDIVLNTYDFSQKCPEVVIFEHVALPYERSVAIRDKLVQHGYRLVSDRHNVMALNAAKFPEYVLDLCEGAIGACRN